MSVVAVDEWCTIPNASVHRDYECTLCDVDITTNKNKFYIMQIIVSPGSRVILYSRYGRIGEKGLTTTEGFDTDWQAIKKFCSKYYSKTGNKWGDSPQIEKKGKYIKMAIDPPLIQTGGSDLLGDGSDTSVSLTPILLHPMVEELIKTISNKETMKTTLKRMNVDMARLPLGKIKMSQINQAEDCLSLIKQYMSKEGINNIKEFGLGRKFINTRLEELSSKFWTLIPRASKRSEKPVIISTAQVLAECVDMIDSIKSIEVAVKLIQHTTTPLDIYNSLHVKLIPLDPGDEEYGMIKTLVEDTHAPTHYYSLTVENIFTVQKDYEQDKNSYFSSIDNHYLLFHGSRNMNYMGILSEGLRVPRSTQVLNGSVLGQGIYFADAITKSFNYCHADNGESGYVLICEVALGTYQEVIYPESNPLPNGSHSRYAVGSSGPDQYFTTPYENMDVSIPWGKINTNQSTAPKGSFQYNEYVIFNPNQYKIRYLLKLKRS